MRRLRHPIRGFSLIEVLIALAVLAVGFAAVAKFQATVFEYSAGAKERAIAARLTEEKIADLRHYETLAPAASGMVSYRDIGTNTGGTLPNGTVTISNVAYSRSWTVANYYYPNTGPAPVYGQAATTTAPNPAPEHPHFKLATVTIQWTDQNNNPQSVAVSTIISAHDPVNSGKTIE
jgi:prepilin-type N-terminal cleavage/methylation domain-containing protein